jgi:hypothetical protein
MEQAPMQAEQRKRRRSGGVLRSSLQAGVEFPEELGRISPMARARIPEHHPIRFRSERLNTNTHHAEPTLSRILCDLRPLSDIYGLLHHLP